MELVVVILVMALLAAVGIVAFNQISSNARIAAAKAELTTVARAAVAELTMREAPAFDAVWVTPLYGEVIAEVEAGETAASGAFAPLGPDTPLTAAGQYGLAFKDLTGQVNAAQGIGVTFATFVDGAVVSVSASAAGTIVDHDGENTAAWAGDALNTAVQQRTNLATNPSFESTGGVVSVRTNLATYPVPTTTGKAASGTFGWTTHWFGGDNGAGDGAGGVTTVAGANDGPLPNLSTYRRKTWAVAPGVGGFVSQVGYAHTFNGGHVGNNATNGYRVAEGQVFTLSAYTRVSLAASVAMRVDFYDETGNPVGRPAYGATVDLAPNMWSRYSATVTVPAGAAYMEAQQWWSGVPVTAFTPGTTLDGTGLLVERSPVLGDYFDGTWSPDPNFTAAWAGAASASVSMLQAARAGQTSTNWNLASVVTSTQWAGSGTRSVRIVPKSSSNDTFVEFFSMIPSAGELSGRTIRVSATAHLDAPLTGDLCAVGVSRARWTRWRAIGFPELPATAFTTHEVVPNQAGNHRVSVTVQVPEYPAGTQWEFARLYSGASAGNGDVWWDDLVVEDVTDQVPTDDSYFDGDTPTTNRSQYRWTGAPHGSVSTSLVW